MNIIFWNTHNNLNINNYLVKLILEKKADLLILAEYAGNIQELLSELEINDIYFKKHENICACEKINIIYNSKYIVTTVRENSRYVGINIEKNKFEMTVFATHFPSLYRYSKDEIELEAECIKKDVDEFERSIIIGDFNSNPFDKAIISASCLSALPTKNKRQRTVQRRKYKNLYNPMWKFFNDFEFCPGTFYYDTGLLVNYYWYIFDQVLISYELIKCYNEDVDIIKSIDNNSLLKNGKIRNEISDHLPLYVSFKEELDE